MDPKNIVILGGGFGGLRTALDMEKRVGKDPAYQILLLDQNTFHLFSASLYEVASGELSSRCVLLPYHKFLKGKNIKFLNTTASYLDPKERFIKTTAGDKITYWRLVVALGADTEDFGIPGVVENSIGLKSVTDAERIRACLLHCSVTKDRPIPVVIGGGGFTGVEVAGELTGYKECPLEITIIEAAPRVLPGMPEIVSKMVSKRMNLLGVRVITSAPIASVEKTEVVLKSGRKIPAEVIIWTAGVRGSRFLDPQVFPLDKKKALVVNEYLRVQGFPEIYAVGDAAGTGVPWTATKAEEDGKIAARNIAAEAKGKSLSAAGRKSKIFEPPFIVPVSRDWAIAKVGKFIFWGKLAVYLKDFVLLYYLFQLLPPLQALRSWWSGECEVLEIRPVAKR